MSRTVTETFEQRDSIQVTQDAKGAMKYDLKCYFESGTGADAVEAIKEIYDAAKAAFEPAE